MRSIVSTLMVLATIFMLFFPIYLLGEGLQLINHQSTVGPIGGIILIVVAAAIGVNFPRMLFKTISRIGDAHESL